MTNAEKVQITRLRGLGLGYTQIANRLGLPKGTVGTFCRRNGLGEGGTSDEKINLLSEPTRGITDTTTTPEAVEIRCSRPSEVTCTIRIEYADKPDETAAADVIDILKNAMRKE